MLLPAAAISQHQSITANRQTSTLLSSKITVDIDFLYKVKVKLKPNKAHNLRTYFFSNRVIQTWKSLPDFVVASSTINSFKNNLGKFWFNEDVKYNWKAELTGTGNRSLSCS